jgi:prepilin-type processing-associated H-X9-DG protein
MKRIAIILLAISLFNSTAPGRPVSPPANDLAIRAIHYNGKLADDEARFTLDIAAEASGAGESSAKLLEGDVAILPGSLPDQLKIIREGNRYLLVALYPGQFKFKLEVVAEIQHAEPWNQISFTGPAATIASVTAQAAGADTEVQLLNGTLLDAVKTNGVSRLTGFLGADQTVALRWQSKVTKIAHKTLLTADSAIAAQITPTVIKYTGKFHYEIVQGNAAQLTLALPTLQSLTRLEGEQIRDWHTTVTGDRQTLTIEFIKPVENSCDLTLYSEQVVESGTGVLPVNGQNGTGKDRQDACATLNPPQPLNVERESGSLTISAEDTLVETAALAGLRQVNATGNALAAYQFNARPFTLALKLKPIEPVIGVTDRVSTRLEETRLVISHRLALNIAKAGIYTLELTPQPGFAIADVHGEGVDDWNFSNGKILVNFSARLLGSRRLDVQLEQAIKDFPDQISVAPLRVTDAARETAQIGAASAPGIRLHTGTLSGLREIPVNHLPDRTDEILAYTTEQPDWKLSVASERLAARVVADVFNVVTIGDGLVGGSATIRYGLVNQGVQEFKVRVPANFKNVEFTGPNIRRKEVVAQASRLSVSGVGSSTQTQTHGQDARATNDVVWTIGLQDKVWGGYTLVVTYDFQFDAKGAALPIGGVHAVDVERETGSVAITTAASLQLNAKSASDMLRRVDEAELSAADRSLIARAVVLAYQYTGNQYDLSVDVKRYAEERVLEAVADRTQITSVLTEGGEMLTQASFMVKNNEKQFQRFQLPSDAKLWGCYVNGQPAKPERDGDWVLVSLPRDVNRDQTFAVDIMYAQTNGALASTWSKTLDLKAPRTDVPNTYAEWQIFVPPTLRLSDFGGSMKVTQGTTYELFDAWEKFLTFYGQVLHETGGGILVIGFLAFLVIALVVSAARRGWSGVFTLIAVMAILFVLGAMLLPALSAAKRKAQRINSVSNLKQVGIAVRLFAGDNGDRLPLSFEEMKNELGTDKITYDTETGLRYTYLGGGMPEGSLKPDSVLAYSPIFNGHCNVLFADGSVAQMTAGGFAELSQRGLVQLATPQEIAVQQQRAAIVSSQFANQPNPPAATPSAGEFVISGAVGAHGLGEPGSGGGSSAVAGIPVASLAAPAPTAAGIRSIRIELPQTGQPFMFTKVLNVRDEPLSIRARIMPLHTFQTIQMAWQSVAFLLGLVVWWWQWRRVQRNTFILTVALALILGSVCSLLIQWRALHDALIVSFPSVTVAVIAWLVWKYWPRGSKLAPESASPAMGIPPVMASIALLFALSLSTVTAADSRITDHESRASIVSASYSGTVNDRVASIAATLQFSAASPGQIVPLFGDDVAVQQFSVKTSRAELVRDGGNIAVRFDSRGDVTLQVKMLVKIAGDVTKRRLAFAIPPALSSQVALVLDESEADVDFPAAISSRRILDQDKTRVEAVMGSADHVELLWTPRVKRAAEVAATVFCQNAALVTFGGGVVNVRATLDYQITQGELRQARVRLPAGQKLLRVEGREIRTWEVMPGSAAVPAASSSGKTLQPAGGTPALPGEQILVVDLLKGIPLNWRLTIETEKVLDALPADVAVETPHALDVKREKGLVALRGAEELALSVGSASGLERVDTEEYGRMVADQTGNLSSVFRFSNPEFALRVRAGAIQPEIEAVARNNFRVSAEQVSLSAVIDYTIKRAGVFTLKVALPAGYRVERVSGSNILQQAERAETGAPASGTARQNSEPQRAGPEASAPQTAGQRILEVTLKERTSGAYILGIELTRDFKELPKSLDIAGAHPLDTAKLTGFVAVSAEPGVAVKTESFDGLTEIPAVSLPDYSAVAGTGSVLAYKFISSVPKSAPEWKLSVATESVAAWVRAEIVNMFTLTETLVSGRALVRYDIANAPVKELRVRVPAAFKNVEITGTNIRSRNQSGDVWRVELQNPTRGFYTLTVTWDEPRAGKTRALELTGISADGVERETGLLSISAKASLQVSESGAADLQRVDAGDFPDWAGSPDNAMALAYRYVRPGYRLTLDVRRFDEAEVLQALVDSARFTSVVADDGQMMTEMSLSVRNNGRQFLEIALPAGAKVWSAFVADQPVRPSLRDGKLLLPIESSGADDGAMTVELTCVGTNAFPRDHGSIGFASPKFDVPLKNARWDVYLPPDYDYQNFSGTMTREIAPAPETLSSSFSSLDYSLMEQAKKASAKVEVDRDVSEARRQLAGGNMREASATFNRAKTRLYADKKADGDVQQLEKDLQTAQASNLINAQNDFVTRNAGEITTDGKLPAQQVQKPGGPDDNAAAGQQWMKLQQAQEIVTAKVQPLRVNLPVRGLHFAFTQVLQTESGRPMTIQLFTASTKAVSWPMRGLTAIGAFLMLWALVAVVSRLTLRAGRS